MDRKIRFGILGFAGIAEKCMIPVLQSSEKCEVAAVASRQALPPDAAPGIRRYIGYDALLDDPSIDAVYIPLPNALHCEWSIRAMRKGKHVLCEKPIAMNAAECEQMIRTSEETGMLLMEAFMYRYSEKIRRLEEILDARTLGPIRGMHAEFGYTLDWKSPAREDRALGGGCLYDIGCYCVSILQLVMKHEKAVVSDAGAYFRMKGDVDWHADGWISYSNGVTASFSSWFDAFARQELALIGEKGTLVLQNPFHEKPSEAIFKTAEGVQRWEPPIVQTYLREADAFADAVAGKADRRMPLSDSLEIMQTLDLLYHHQGRK